MKSVYIHIPFCSNICSYCDFPKLYYNKNIISDYLDSLEKEIINSYNNELIETIYIGGGTPSSLSVDELEKLFKIISIFKITKNYEFSIECNPENMDEEKIKLFQKYGVNRVSIGVQSFNDTVLGLLNRKHNKNDIFKLINLLKSNGINNINIDLIFGVNGQTIDNIKYDLDEFLKLEIPHLSYYSLILENNTILSVNNYKEIDDDICASMYNYIRDYLLEKGYIQYEISNFSKIGYESKHNLTYWNNDNYYGFGLGAHGYINNFRYENTRSITEYIKNNYLLNKEFIDYSTNLENEIILNLRKTKGINKNKFYFKYKKNIYDVFNINELIDNNLLIDDGFNVYIDSKYLFVSNEILLRILNSRL